MIKQIVAVDDLAEEPLIKRRCLQGHGWFLEAEFVLSGRMSVIQTHSALVSRQARRTLLRTELKEPHLDHFQSEFVHINDQFPIIRKFCLVMKSN